MKASRLQCSSQWTTGTVDDDSEVIGFKVVQCLGFGVI